MTYADVQIAISAARGSAQVDDSELAGGGKPAAGKKKPAPKKKT